MNTRHGREKSQSQPFCAELPVSAFIYPTSTESPPRPFLRRPKQDTTYLHNRIPKARGTDSTAITLPRAPHTIQGPSSSAPLALPR